jgi:predicted metal-dependent HD superfamily phosphohydrolase
MTENQFKILSEVEDYVSDIFLNKVDKSIHFHTLQHTNEVVAGCETMADYYKLDDEDHFALLLAAWFHDTGYSQGAAKGHEDASVHLATNFLQQKEVSPEVIDKVVRCINVTKLPQNPTLLIEQIICDADLFHLGTSDFKEKNKLLRDELNDFGNMELSKKDWRKKNIEFLTSHKYFTSYAKENLDPLKQVYLQQLSKKAGIDDKDKKPAKDSKDHVPALVAKKDKPKDKGLSPEEQKKLDEVKKKKEKETQSERAISTVFRIVAQSQNNLSQMADSKANILISVNAIVLSVIIGTLFDNLLTDPNLQIPVIILVSVCVLAIVFGILATRPNVTSGTFTKEDIANKKTNLLFFGNFHKMGLPDYDWAMTELLADKNYLYSSMIKDSYFLGIVLAKKYRYLRIAYNIFMYGLILAMIAFVIALLIPDATEVYGPPQ